MLIIKRIISKILDYSWFFSLLLFVLDIFNFDILYYFIALVALPTLFIPFEAISIKLFRTTLGKIIFGLQYERKFTWKEAFGNALKTGIFIQPLFIPGINLLYAFLYLRDIKKKGYWKGDNYSTFNVIQKKPKFLARSIIVSCAAILSLFCFTPDFALNQVAKVVPIEKLNLIKRNAISFVSPSNWVMISPEELTFTAFFPKDPKFREKEYPIPKSSQALHFKEYFYESNINYSLAYVELPTKWTKWGANVVFKGCFKFLIPKGATVLHKNKSTYGSYPALEYEINHEGKKITGKLVMVKNTIYKMEIKFPSDHNKDEVDLAEKFLNSFTPKV